MKHHELTQITETNLTQSFDTSSQRDIDLAFPCDECEDDPAGLYCEGCEQKLCTVCDAKIHNKGKRAQHTRQKLSCKHDFLQIQNVIFVSHSFLELKPGQDPEKVHKTIYDYLQAQLQPLKLDPKKTFVHVCHEGTLSSDAESELRKNFSKVAQYFELENLFTLQESEAFQQARIENDVVLVNNEQTVRWARATLLLAKGICVERIFILYPLSSLEIGCLLQSSEQLSENTKIYFSENLDSELSNVTASSTVSGTQTGQNSNNAVSPTFSKQKLVELTPKRFMKFINDSRQREKQSASRDDSRASNEERKLDHLKVLSFENTSDLPPKNKMGAGVFQQQVLGNEIQAGTPTYGANSYTFNQQYTPNLFLNQSVDHTPNKNPKQANQLLASNQSFDGALGGMALNNSMTDYLNNSCDRIGLQSSALNRTFAHLEEQILRNQPSQAQSNQHHLSRGTNNIFAYLCQPLKDKEIEGSLKISHYLQQTLRNIALQGDLMVPKPYFEKLVSEDIQKKFNKNPESVLKKAEEANLIHTTIRKFVNTEPLYFVGLHLETITVESLGWIVKSIQKDGMTPTEKLIISRIKECFALKIDVKIWKTLINFLLSLESPAKKFPKGDGSTILPLKVSKVIEPLLGTETYVITLKNEPFVPEDQGTIDESSELWKSFISFIDEFFKKDEEDEPEQSDAVNPNLNTSSTLNSEGQKKPTTAMWSSSVENILSRSSNKKEKNLKSGKDIKAIPGGRYGCAQFIKVCGPECLREISLGKLNLIVQEAINKGVLRYQRTLLVKNTQTGSFSFDGKHEISDASASFDPVNMSDSLHDNSSFTQEGNHEKKSVQLAQIKRALYELLLENPGGLSLAQIPQFLRKKLPFSFNLQELGFPKLKNLLAIMSDDVKIELSGTNHSFAVLKNPQKFAKLHKELMQKADTNSLATPPRLEENLEHKNQDPYNNLRLNTGPFASSPHFTQHGNNLQSLGNTHSGTNILGSATEPDFNSYPDLTHQDKKFNALTPTLQPSKPLKVTNRKKMSTLEEYFGSVRAIIQMIITENSYGLHIDKLCQMLSMRLGFEFDYRLFNCSSFYEFLINSVDNLIDIEVRKNKMQQVSYVIYPKNYRFGPPGIIRQEQQYQDTNTTPIKGDPFGGNLTPNYPQYESKKFPTSLNVDFFNSSPNYELTANSANKLEQDYSTKPKPISHRASQSIGNPYMSSFRPMFNYGEERSQNANPFDVEGSPQHNRRVSFLNISPEGNTQSQLQPTYFSGLGGRAVSSYTGGQMPQYTNISTISNIHTAPHSRNPSKNMRIPEESNIEINENLRFIEDLLKENENETMLSFSDRGDPSFISPNLSYTTIPHAQFVFPKNHSKTLSGDFPNQQSDQKPGLKTHGRVYSSFNPAENRFKNNDTQNP